jgi:hypothetical protein
MNWRHIPLALQTVLNEYRDFHQTRQLQGFYSIKEGREGGDCFELQAE